MCVYVHICVCMDVGRTMVAPPQPHVINSLRKWVLVAKEGRKEKQKTKILVTTVTTCGAAPGVLFSPAPSLSWGLVCSVSLELPQWRKISSPLLTGTDTCVFQRIGTPYQAQVPADILSFMWRSIFPHSRSSCNSRPLCRSGIWHYALG